MDAKKQAEAIYAIYKAAQKLAYGLEGWDDFYVLVVHHLQAAEAAERERCAKAVCGRCAKGMPLTPNLQHFHACETPETCAAPEDHIHFDGRIGYETGCEAEPIYRLPAPPSTPEAE